MNNQKNVPNVVSVRLNESLKEMLSEVGSRYFEKENRSGTFIKLLTEKHASLTGLSDEKESEIQLLTSLIKSLESSENDKVRAEVQELRSELDKIIERSKLDKARSLLKTLKNSKTA